MNRDSNTSKAPQSTASFPPGVSSGISHGTLECGQIARARAFYTDFLGVQTLRHGQPAFMTWLSEGPNFAIACVMAGEQARAQTRDNRWELSLDSAEDVAAAHAAAIANKDGWGIRHVDPLTEQDGYPWFCLQDVDGNWWGLSNRGLDWLETAFEHAIKD
ncbi:VOC family protein [Pusillimonas sp.]|uniref:VOC family protein n=1 Tax=Pusillimonas sp. TaxID=3040095 RepID=UPI0029A5D909|nr:VOC family protein [Pusillimonas sp.]MDX3895546.1 VOC family protein [Pusillimonas sp.]